MSKDKELFNLCKQVYEATGWGEKHKISWFVGDNIWDTTMQSDYEYGGEDWQCPLYNSDYLLEKLPGAIYIISNSEDPRQEEEFALRCEAPIVNFKSYGKMWSFFYSSDVETKYWSEGVTPLKALLKLTLALHEEGLL